LLDYGLPPGNASPAITRKVMINSKALVNKGRINVGLLGVGNFAQSVHLPNLKKLENKFNIYALASHSGVKAKNAGTFYNAQYVTTEYDEIINDSNTDLVMICTRHGNHASLALQALKAGKHVFVEKPLATNVTDLRLLEEFIETNPDKLPLLMVGYNRRFSPYANEIRKHTDQRIGPLFIHYRMNAGFQPHDHWTHQDGGRIIGEACHIVDLVNSLTNSGIVSCHVESIDSVKGKFTGSDNKSILLKYDDGSVAAIEYLSLGSRSMAKEYMEIHFDEKSIVLNDYKELDAFGITIKNLRSKTSLKGHMEELEILYSFLNGKIKEWPVEWWQLLQTTKTLLAIE
jgi:predicted dehydrogenase